MTDDSGIRLTIDEQNPGGDPRVIVLDGYLDESTRDAIVEAIESAFADGCSRIALDFQRVNFVTSTGFAALMHLWNTARELGGDLVVIHPPSNINVLMRVLRMNQHITVADDREAAVEHFARLAELPEPLPADDGEGPATLPGDPPEA